MFFFSLETVTCSAQPRLTISTTLTRLWILTCRKADLRVIPPTATRARMLTGSAGVISSGLEISSNPIFESSLDVSISLLIMSQGPVSWWKKAETRKHDLAGHPTK